MIRGIHHVAIHTPDLDRLVAFYRDVVGFEVVEGSASQWEGKPAVDAIIGVPESAARTVMLNAGNLYLEFFQYSNPPARNSDRLRPSDHGYTHIALDVDDVFAEHARLTAAGMVFNADPLDAGNIKAVYGRDPDGNVVEIQQLSRDQIFSTSKLRPRFD